MIALVLQILLVIAMWLVSGVLAFCLLMVLSGLKDLPTDTMAEYLVGCMMFGPVKLMIALVLCIIYLVGELFGRIRR